MTTRKAVPAVEARNVTKNYGNVKALKGINLTIEQGEVVAFLGPNGAGKSTAISLMLGMRRPTTGSVFLFGENPRIADHRRRIGAMLQESGVPGTLKVRELVEMFGRFHDNPMETREVLEIAGLLDQANTHMYRLSGGQKQRVYFALALVGNPDVFFLDEPTTGLDVEVRRRFWEQIRNQVALGKTIILTTHNLEEADTLANRIIVINQGEIIADGTPGDIKRHIGGKHISFRAPRLTLAELQKLPGAQGAQVSGHTFEFYTTQPELLLATLFRNGAELSDLEVTGAGLEEAFILLTSRNEA